MDEINYDDLSLSHNEAAVEAIKIRLEISTLESKLKKLTTYMLNWWFEKWDFEWIKLSQKSRTSYTPLSTVNMVELVAKYPHLAKISWGDLMKIDKNLVSQKVSTYLEFSWLPKIDD